MDELLELMTNADGDGSGGRGRRKGNDNNTRNKNDGDGGGDDDDVGLLFLDDDDDDDDDRRLTTTTTASSGHTGASSSSSFSSGPGIVSGSQNRRSSSNFAATTSSSTSVSARQPQQRPKNKSKNSNSNSNFLGNVRILYNRQLSSVTFHEMMSEHLVFSPAALVALPLGRLNTLLESPARIVDPATVSGTTIPTFMTAGMVFKNSGTRLSASTGSAFCILSVGSNFSSGPCMSVFLFGEAYGQYMKQCQPGQVICLLNCPKLLPPSKNGNKSNAASSTNNDHAITFSISKKEQVRLVGTAQDFGYCKATNIRKKQPNGSWANNGTCSNWIDKRQPSPYCQFHKNVPQNSRITSSASSVAAVMNSKMTKLQQLRQKQTQSQQLQRVVHNQQLPVTMMVSTTMTRRQGTNMHQLSSSSTSTSTSTGATRTNRFGQSIKISSTKTPALSSSSANSSSSNNNNNKLLNPYRTDKDRGTLAGSRNGGNSNQILRQMVQGETNPGGRQLKSGSGDSSTSSAGLMKSEMTYKSTDWLEQTIKGAPATSKKRPVLSLSEDAKHAAAAAKKPKILVHGKSSQFDGSVMIPTPSKTIFGPSSSSSQPVANVTPSAEEHAARKLQQHQHVLNRQREVAMKLKSQQGDNNEVDRRNINSKQIYRGTKTSTSASARINGSSNAASSFLEAMGGGPVDDSELEIVRDAKSRFFDEITAEQYAKSREKVSELERMEESHEERSKNKKKRNNEPDKPQLSKCWVCLTCGQTYKFRPKSCITSNHEVSMRREIVKAKTTTERRLKVHDKDIGDGGLKLGSGLEWDNFRRGGGGGARWSRFS